MEYCQMSYDLYRCILKAQDSKVDQNKYEIVQNLWAEQTETKLFFEI